MLEGGTTEFKGILPTIIFTITLQTFVHCQTLRKILANCLEIVHLQFQ